MPILTSDISLQQHNGGIDGACGGLGHVGDAALLAEAALTESTSTAAGQNSQKLARY